MSCGEIDAHRCACLLLSAVLQQALSKLFALFLTLAIIASMLNEGNSRYMETRLRVGEYAYSIRWHAALWLHGSIRPVLKHGPRSLTCV